MRENEVLDLLDRHLKEDHSMSVSGDPIPATNSEIPTSLMNMQSGQIQGLGQGRGISVYDRISLKRTTALGDFWDYTVQLSDGTSIGRIRAISNTKQKSYIISRGGSDRVDADALPLNRKILWYGQYLGSEGYVTIRAPNAGSDVPEDYGAQAFTDRFSAMRMVASRFRDYWEEKLPADYPNINPSVRSFLRGSTQ